MVGNINSQKFNIGFASYNGVNIKAKPLNNCKDIVSFNHNDCNNQTKNPALTNTITGQYSLSLLSNIFTNLNFVNSLLSRNENVKALLSSVGIKNPEVHINNINNEKYKHHIMTTTAYAMQIADVMGLSQADRQTLIKAATFHDFGKVLMPENILNKNGKLTPEESTVINTHAEIGAELLETAGMDKRVTNIIRNHHNPQTNDILCNILSVADVYSALTEERCYKKALTRQEALKILDQDAKGGKVSTEVLNALKTALIKNQVA